MPYYKLTVWGKSMELCEMVYEVTKKLPPDERFGLTSQLRRAAVSIPSNIAEGSQRKTEKDFANFLNIAQGSAVEVETQLELCLRMHFRRNSPLIANFSPL